VIECINRITAQNTSVHNIERDTMTSTLLTQPITLSLSDYRPIIRACIAVLKGWGSIQSEHTALPVYTRFNMDKSATRVQGDGGSSF